MSGRARERRAEPKRLHFALHPVERRGERSRVTELLLARAVRSVRILCAPAGCGKTVALQHQAARKGTAVRRVTRSSAGAPTPLDDGLWERGTRFIDDFDLAPPAAIEAFIERLASGADSNRYVIAGRSPQRMLVHRFLAGGIGTVIDAPLLAFRLDEVAALANRYELSYATNDLERIVRDTEGWPIAVHWLLRYASDSGAANLKDAFERWLVERARYFCDNIAEAYGCDPDAYLSFTSFLRSPGPDERERLERFESLGFPIARSRSALRPYAILERLVRDEATPASLPEATPSILSIKLFGRFSCDIGGRQLSFVRRRDRSIFCHVALSPEGRSTREELIAAFWPGQRRDAAAQALRTSLSHIRQAIRDIVGTVEADRYFSTDKDVAFDLGAVSIDTRRFLEHVRFGQIEEAQAKTASARHHYEAAERLYADRLLASEFLDDVFAGESEKLERTYVDLLGRLIAACKASGNLERAAECVDKLARRTADSRVRAEILAMLGPAATA